MPRTKLSEYSTTNSDNTDIESINIAEGCAPSGINNAIRELMVHLKEFQTGASGDAFTFAGGVLMSGTNTITGSTTATFAAGAVGTPSIAAHGDTNTGIFFPAADTIAFAEGGVEGMRIDSSGNVLVKQTSNVAQPGNYTPNLSASGLNDGGLAHNQYSTSAGVGGQLWLSRSKSATVGQTIVASGDQLGAINFSGSDGTNFVFAARITGEVDGTPGTNDMPGRLVFRTTADGASTLTERMRITSTGDVLLNNAAALIGTNTSDGSDTSSLVISGGGGSATGRGAVLQLFGNESASTGIAQLFSGNVTGSYVNIIGRASDSYIRFDTGGTTERMRIDSSGNVGIGTSSPSYRLDVSGFDATARINSSVAGGNSALRFLSGTGNNAAILFGDTDAADVGFIQYVHSDNSLRVNVNSAERARITSGGDFLVGKTADVLGNAGSFFDYRGSFTFTRDNSTVGYINRLTSDGTLLSFLQATTEEGTISVSGTTVSYNGGHLSRWAQMPEIKDDTLVKGTVMSNLDEMNVYIAPTTYWTEEDELPEGVNVGDVKVETHAVDNEQLNKVKVSDVEGDVNVAGVFVNWTHDDAHQVDEINMAMTGDMIIRIAQGVVVQKGDLLMSAGDGTAKPQGDDIVRSKTVAKVTSNHVTCTYADGSYCVPCVLMAC